MFGTYRTLLAMMVVVTHLGGVLEIGGYAVFGFYTLSGYLMTLIMHESYGYTMAGVSKYAINRLLRIYPIYWVAISFSALLIVAVGEEVTTKYHAAIYLPHNISETLKNVFLFFPQLNHELPRLSPPVWALTVEIFYYILIGLGLSKYKKIVVLWLLLSVAFHVSVILLGLDGGYRYHTIPAASLPFAMGAFIFHYKHEILCFTKRASETFLSILPFIIFLSIILNWYVGSISSHRGLFFYSNFILCAIMVVALSERKSLPFISRLFDKWMGDFSYPIYLIHYQVGLVVVILLGKAGLVYERPDFVLLFISAPFIFTFSWLITVGVEKPIEMIRTRIKAARL